MRVGILGSGLMGAKLGTIFARAGHEVVFSYARSEQKLKRLAREAGGKARAGTPREATQNADAVLLALLDSESEHKAPLGRIVLGGRGHDANVDIAVLEVEPPQQIAVGLDPVGIIDVGILQE